MRQSPIYKEIQESFQQGAWPENYCTKCRDLEATYPDQRYSKRLANINNLQLYNNHHGKLMDLVIDTGRLCNLQCRSCNPTLSSSWIVEAQRLPKQLHQFDRSSNNLSEITVWPITEYKHQEDDFSNLIYVNIIGGEPLYNSASINEYLEKILRLAGPNCRIELSTNGTVSYKTIPLLKEFNTVGITFSLDATELASEFIRTGSNWESVKNNILECKDFGFLLGCHPTFSVLNMFNIADLRKFILEFDMIETKEVTFVKHPDFLSYKILTDQERIKASKYLEKNNLQFIKEQFDLNPYNPNSRKDFFTFMEHTKQYHNMDWQDYLPELYALMNY